MSTIGSTIASFGGSLKIYQAGSGKLVETATYGSDGVAASQVCSDGALNRGRVSWAGDGRWLVGPVERTSVLPVFKYDKGKKLTRMRHITDADISAAACFNCTNRTIAIGSQSGAVKIWNVKDKKVQKTLCEGDPEPVKLVEVSTSDVHVAACGAYSARPAVKVYGLTTSRLVETLPLPEPAEITDLKFSPVRKGYVGCCTMDGAVLVWDILKSSPVMKVASAHVGACMGMALSPINYHLASSVALDYSLNIYDIRSSEKVLQVAVDARLTAVDFLHGEPCLVLGAQDGRVLLFDLRTSSVVAQVQAHERAVDSVRAAMERPATKFEDAVVNTPDQPVVHLLPLELSVTDVVTPPFQRSVVGRALNGGGIIISPISPGSAWRAGTHSVLTQSTPNAPANDDSFIRLMGDSPAQSPAFPRHTITPSPGFPLHPIHEDGTPEDVLPDQHLTAATASSASTTTSPVQEVTREQLQGVSRKELRGMLKEELRSIVREELREMMRGELREVLREELGPVRGDVQRNNEVLHSVRNEVIELPYIWRSYQLGINGNLSP